MSEFTIEARTAEGASLTDETAGALYEALDVVPDVKFDPTQAVAGNTRRRTLNARFRVEADSILAAATLATGILDGALQRAGIDQPIAALTITAEAVEESA